MANTGNTAKPLASTTEMESELTVQMKKVFDGAKRMNKSRKRFLTLDVAHGDFWTYKESQPWKSQVF